MRNLKKLRIWFLLWSASSGVTYDQTLFGRTSFKKTCSYSFCSVFMLIEEIYHPHPRMISSDKTIGEAIQLMFEQGCNGYVVVDSRDHVVGVLSLQDIAGRLLPTEFRENTSMTQAMYRKGFFAELCREIAPTPITSVMRRDFISVDLKANILTVLADFLQNDLYLIPVIEQGHLIGILTRTDVRKAIASGMRQATQD